MLNNIDREELKTQLDKAVKKQKRSLRLMFALMSTAMLVIFGVITAVVFASNPQLSNAMSGNNNPAFLVAFLPLLGFFFAVMFQWMSVFFDTEGVEQQLRGQMASRVVAEMVLESSPDVEKAKRTLDDMLSESRLSVGADGELVETEHADEEAVKRQSKR